MKTAVKLLVVAVACAAGVANAKITDTDWASIETPDVWDYNKDPNGFDVVVTLKEGAPIDGNFIARKTIERKTSKNFQVFFNKKEVFSTNYSKKFEKKDENGSKIFLSDVAEM